MKRESGFYWVKVDTDTEWVIAEWSEAKGAWYFAGTMDFATESYLYEINETRLTPS